MAKYNVLQGKRVAILVADGFEEIEMTSPREALDLAGAQTELVTLNGGEVRAFKRHTPANKFITDKPLASAKVADYDALLLPGGAFNPDQLRHDQRAVRFVKGFFDAKKPVAALCHAPWTLVEAGVLAGRTVTSWPSIKTDLINAGAKWVNQEVVVENRLVTGRGPQDLTAFNQKMIETFASPKRGVWASLSL